MSEGASDDLEGAVLVDRYEVEALIGRGGMGAVYAARDRKLRRRVAIKTFTATGVDADLERRRLRAEAEAIAQIEHAAIVSIHDVVEDGDRVLLVMELVEGTSLRARLGHGPLPPREVATIVAGVAAGLAAAHARGLVHRDVKPDNVVVRSDGRAALLDFGIAKNHAPTPQPAHSSAEPALTQPGSIVGTPSYMSPEQARGEPVGPPSDQFSLAVTAYELLTGAIPWASQDLMRLVAAILEDAPPQVAPSRGLDPEVDRVLSRALAKRAGDRFATVDAFGEALARALGASRRSVPATLALASTVGDGGAVSEAVATVRRRSAARTTGIAVALVALTIGATLAVSTHRSQTPATPAIAPSATTSSPASSASTRQRLSDLPPSQSQSEAARTAYRRAMRRLAHGEAAAAEVDLEAALAADPELASAHLQRLLHETYYCPTKLAIARPHFVAARRAEQTLSERDRELLNALEPTVLDPPDLVAAAARIHALADRRPNDAQIWEAVSIAENKLFHFARSAEAARRALALSTDESLPAAALVLAQDVGGVEGRAIVETCVRDEGANEWCRAERGLELSVEGACADLERNARDALVLTGEAKSSARLLADALAGQGESTEAIAIALATAREGVAQPRLARVALHDRVNLAIWSGAFDDALKGLDEASSDDVVWVATERLAVLTEIGDVKGAGEVGLAYLKRAAALARFERPELDPMPRAWAAAAAGGLLTEADRAARRSTWVAGWRKRLDDEAWRAAGPVIWGLSSVGIASHGEAVDAVAQAAELGGLPPMRDRQFWTHDGEIGDVLRMAGRIDDAIPRLRSEAQRCSFELLRVQAHRGLGRALEEKGDQVGACAAYAFVVERWGAARPRSVTAEDARTRSAALGCARTR